ncbi:MAG: cell division protein SepF, partial [Actinomycetota bacterium]
MAGVWKKTLIYLGLAEEDDYDEYRDYAYDDIDDQEPAPARRQELRKVPERERESASARRESVVRAMPTTS